MTNASRLVIDENGWPALVADRPKRVRRIQTRADIDRLDLGSARSARTAALGQQQRSSDAGRRRRLGNIIALLDVRIDRLLGAQASAGSRTARRSGGAALAASDHEDRSQVWAKLDSERATVVLSSAVGDRPEQLHERRTGPYEQRLAAAKAAIYGEQPDDIKQRIAEVKEALDPRNQPYDVNV